MNKNTLEKIASYQEYRWKNPKLRWLFFEITDGCNLNCLHCGSNCKSRNSTELPLEVIKKVMKEVTSEYGSENLLVCLTGGEPLLYPDIEEVLQTAQSLGIFIGMTTNGTLVTEEKAFSLVKAGLQSVSVSIDGFESTHDAFRRVDGCFKKAMEGIYNFRKAGLEVEPITVIHKKNIHELEDMYNFFISEGFKYWRIAAMDPIGRAKKNASLLLDSIEIKRLLDFIKEKHTDKNSPISVTSSCPHFVTLDYEHEIRDWYFQCTSGTTIASIRANGNIVACLDIEDTPKTIQGNIYKDSFVDVWKNGFKIYRQDRTSFSTTCKNCSERKICLGDSAHTWDFDRNEPNYCIKNLLDIIN